MINLLESTATLIALGLAGVEAARHEAPQEDSPTLSTYLPGQEPQAASVETTPTAQALRKVGKIVASVVDSIPLSGQMVTALSKERYQSDTFRRAGFQHLPDRYGKADRELFLLTFDDGSQMFIIHGKVANPNNPFQVGAAAAEGVDLRANETTIYYYDGKAKGTITEIKPGHPNNIYTGEFGRPEALLPAIRRTLGLLVKRKDFILSP